MSIYDLPSPRLQHIAYTSSKFFELWILDLISSSKLLDDEFRIRTKLYLRRTEFDRSSDTEESRSILSDIIGRMSDIFMAFLERLPPCIGDEYPTTRRSGISSRSTIRKYYDFHTKEYKQ